MKTIRGHVKQPVHEAHHLGPPLVLPGPLSQFPEDNGGCNTLPEMAEVTKEDKLDICHVLHLPTIALLGVAGLSGLPGSTCVALMQRACEAAQGVQHPALALFCGWKRAVSGNRLQKSCRPALADIFAPVASSF